MPQFSMPKFYEYMQEPTPLSDNERFKGECDKIISQGMTFKSHTEMARYFFEAGKAWEHGKKIGKHQCPIDWEITAQTAAYFAKGYEHKHDSYSLHNFPGIDGQPVFDQHSYNMQKYSGMHFTFDVHGLVAFVEEMIKIYL